MTQQDSWGLHPSFSTQLYLDLKSRITPLPNTKSSVLPRGLGRSYGDSCLNENGTLVGTKFLNHFISLNENTGALRCEAGASFEQILQLVVPKGWFLPVTPGTKFVTVAGAIANDVHGKNHHTAGNFGHHVTCFELLRSSGERLLCSRTENSELFYATIGGLGLTGFITWAEFNLNKIPSAWIEQEQILFHSMEEFFELSEQSEASHEFTVSWVDCISNASDIRGIFMRGNYASAQSKENLKLHNPHSIKTIPIFFPDWALNKYTIHLFNEVYFHKNFSEKRTDIVHYDPFFYPLDSIHHWNKIYGRRGFLQYQFVIPYKNDAGIALKKILAILKQSQMGSFLAVLKTFGQKKSEGLLSFPQEGVTLALDFPNYGEPLLKVLEQCDAIVREVNGAVYPAKDARMSAESFKAFYPRLDEFEKYKDPQFSSSFWRRVR